MLNEGGWALLCLNALELDSITPPIQALKECNGYEIWETRLERSQSIVALDEPSSDLTLEP